MKIISTAYRLPPTASVTAFNRSVGVWAYFEAVEAVGAVSGQAMAWIR